MLTLVLPFPPSVNTYWTHTRFGARVCDRGVAFRNAVSLIAMQHRARGSFPLRTEQVAVVELYPPDRAARDHDNWGKGLWDSLAHAGVIENDGLIREGTSRLCAPLAGGACIVCLTPAHGPRQEWDSLMPLPPWCEGKKLAKQKKVKAVGGVA